MILCPWKRPDIRQKPQKLNSKDHYKNSTRFIHNKRRENIDIVETSGHLDTNVAIKNLIDITLKETQTPPAATPMKEKGKKTIVPDAIRSELQVIDVYPITYIIAKL
jgi:hypothetical protein